ncbi:hypothetical protein HK097_007301, partial [Rhizophlyctis rosea]
VVGKRKREEGEEGVDGVVPDRDELATADESLPLSVMDALLTIRDRYDVVGKTHLARETSIKQCMRCLNCSTLTDEAETGSGSAPVKPEKAEVTEEPVKTEEGAEQVPGENPPNDSARAEREPPSYSYKGPPPWSDAFGFACICGGRWWKIAAVL